MTVVPLFHRGQTWRWLVGKALCVLALIAPHAFRYTLEAQSPEKVQVETLYVELTPDGFLPNQISTTSATLFLKIRNTSRLPVEVIGAADIDRKPVANMMLDNKKGQGTLRLSVAQGNYSFSVANQPDWKLRLAVN